MHCQTREGLAGGGRNAVCSLVGGGWKHSSFNGQAQSFGFRWQSMREGCGRRGTRGCPGPRASRSCSLAFQTRGPTSAGPPFQGAADTPQSRQGSRQPRSVGFVFIPLPLVTMPGQPVWEAYVPVSPPSPFPLHGLCCPCPCPCPWSIRTGVLPSIPWVPVGLQLP